MNTIKTLNKLDNKITVDIVFCILVYKNYLDLLDLLESLNKNLPAKYSVVVVDAFYSKEISSKIREVCCANNCDYIQCENKGYSYGNNKGIEYIYTKYVAKKIIVSNPDIKLAVFDENIFEKEDFLVAPEIIARTGKKQNPYYKRYSRFKEYALYHIYKSKSNILLFMFFAIQKIADLICSWHKPQKIYAAHGSCLIFDYEKLESCLPIFDDHMFLFCEENYLAYKIRSLGETVFYDKDFVVNHKEDGSMGGVNVYKIARKSYIYYYEHKNDIKKMEVR